MPNVAASVRKDKNWICDECGRKMTARQAERALSKGCPKGCSGIDIREITPGQVIDLMAALRESLRAAPSSNTET